MATTRLQSFGAKGLPSLRKSGSIPNGSKEHTAASAGRRHVLKSIATLFAFSAALLRVSQSNAIDQGVDTMSDNGLITVPSAHSAKDTIDRIEADVKSKGMTVFARIDHAAGANEVGLKLAPTELLIFGNAKAGTPLMQSHQQIGIDLPLKMLAWEDPSGKRWLSYNDPVWLARRHGLGHELDETVKGMAAALSAIAKKASA
jgi:uncharacterized protein (DUF302 family)